MKNLYGNIRSTTGILVRILVRICYGNLGKNYCRNLVKNLGKNYYRNLGKNLGNFY